MQKIKVKIILSLAQGIVFLLLFIFLFMFGIRGTFAFYPLKINDAIVSPSIFINSLVPNGVYSLKTAFKDKKEQNINTNINQTLKKWGFSSIDEAISIYSGQKVNNDPDSLVNALFARTPENDFLAQNPPNVVFIQMESMSEDFIALHNKETFNLLGSLENVLPECIHFTHFLSATDNTIGSLESILLNTPLSPVSQSIYMDQTLETSAAKPFKDKGYHTSFVTGSKLGWRNLDKFIPHQYFDNTEGSAHIEKFVPHTLSNEWGTYDEFMFMRIYDLLAEKNSKPQFIYGMTITNHTPYSLPETYKPYPLQIPDSLKAKLSAGEKHAQVHFSTYQYANDCLGRFIERVKNSDLRENTIIVATGDHTARRIFEYPDANLLQKYAVPLILYIPEKYRQNVDSADTEQFGSHKDIFPTIYHVALSDAKYVKSGVNLFDNNAVSANFAITGYRLVMNSRGCIFFEVEPVYYVWQDAGKTKLKIADDKEREMLQKDMVKGKAYAASMTYLIQNFLSEKSSHHIK